MTVPRRTLRTIRPIIETLLAGIFLGIVGTSLVTQALLAGGPPSSASQEVPLARAFMFALITNDLDMMADLAPGTDPLGQAIAFQKRADALKGLRVESLTYLGGSALGSVGVHVYVVQTNEEDAVSLVPFVLTVYRGKVVRVE